jgi:hypothetical protein
VKKIIAASCLVFISFGLMAQPKEGRSASFSVSGGVGMVHYINTLKVGANSIDEDHGCFSFRVMWEPEHRLSLGVESGYYTFYNLSKTATTSNPLTGESSLSIVPILINLRMRVVKNFYLTAGPGVSILFSKTTALGSTAESSQLSLADYQTSALYLRPFNKRISLGAELKFLSIGKTEDNAVSLQAMAVYKF